MAQISQPEGVARATLLNSDESQSPQKKGGTVKISQFESGLYNKNSDYILGHRSRLVTVTLIFMRNTILLPDCSRREDSLEPGRNPSAGPRL